MIKSQENSRARLITSGQIEQCNFLQTSQFLIVRSELGWKPVVFEREYGLFYGSFGGGRVKYLDILMGANLDYSIPEIVQKFTNDVKSLAKDLGATFVRMNPNIVRTILSATGEPQSASDNLPIGNLKNNGWRHNGLTVGSEGSPRFLFVKNLTIDGSTEGKLMTETELFESFRKGHQNCIKKAETAGVTLRNLSFEELHLFKAVTSETGNRRGFQDKTLDYYQAFYKAFCENIEDISDEMYNNSAYEANKHFAQFRVAEIDLHFYTEIVQTEVDKWQLEVDAHQLKIDKGQKKAQGQLNNALEIRDAAIKRLKQANKWKAYTKPGEKLIIAASIFVENSGEMVYFLSGMIDEYRDLFAPHLLQYDIMCECLKRGIKRYNFYGVDGIFDGTSPETGVLTFKQGFGGYVEELIGQFELPVNKLLYALKGLR